MPRNSTSLLLADLLTRTVEPRNLQVLTAVASGDRSYAQLAALEPAADALGIHPPAPRVGSGDARTSLGGPIDVHFAGDAVGGVDRGSGLVTRVGAAYLQRAGDRDEAAGELALSLGQFPPSSKTGRPCSGRRGQLPRQR